MANSADATDRALLARIARKDRGAFEQLYRRYYPRVYPFSLNLVRQAELAEEVVDDTLFAVWRTADGFAGKSAVSTWILGIAYRQGLKVVDRESRRREHGTDTHFLETVPDHDEFNEPDRSAAFSQLSDQLARAVKALGPDHQTAMHLAAQGYNATEIGEILQCSTSTIRTRLFYARKKIKAFLADSDATVLHTRTGTHDE